MMSKAAKKNWFRRYRRCKFTYCAYKHSEKEIIKDLQEKVEELERRIEEKDGEMKRQNENIVEINTKIKDKD